MFITKEEIKNELKDEECWKKGLSKNEKEMFLIYCTNGHEELHAFEDVYMREDVTRKIKFPGIMANEIVAKEAFQDCIAIYADILREAVSTKANAWMFNQYYAIATANHLDFVDEIGQFKFKSIKEAQEILGIKALAIERLEVTAHPRDPKSIMTVPKLYDKFKAMKELAKFTKFYGSEEAGGVGLGEVSISSKLAVVNKEDDEVNRRRIGLGEK